MPEIPWKFDFLLIFKVRRFRFFRPLSTKFSGKPVFQKSYSTRNLYFWLGSTYLGCKHM
ncbi:hypothetical protein M5D96_011687 [Drosophila gunungcola]|uniref:Uncharacterized protein n=1 Tax=Drosophila gunungcola TaxID=103775 RepID=A0A9P9YEH1_9MUSC|nr:hypothetical protein M5D96_011687 [Drosophila gunungcola]